MRGAGRQVHRLGEPPRSLEAMVVLFAQFRHRVAAKNAGADPLAGGLPGDRLRAVLAELGRLAVLGVGIGPGAARTVEPVAVIQGQQRLDAAPDAHLLQGVAGGLGDGRNADGVVFGGPTSTCCSGTFLRATVVSLFWRTIVEIGSRQAGPADAEVALAPGDARRVEAAEDRQRVPAVGGEGLPHGRGRDSRRRTGE